MLKNCAPRTRHRSPDLSKQTPISHYLSCPRDLYQKLTSPCHEHPDMTGRRRYQPWLRRRPLPPEMTTPSRVQPKLLILVPSAFSLQIGIASEEESYRALSNGLEDNVVTSHDGCQWVEINLPEPLLSLELDGLYLPCNNGSCKVKNNETIAIKYQQEKEGRYYKVSAQFCELEVKNYFRIGWEIEHFEKSGRKTLLTQFIVSEDNWSVNNISCIQPQYYLPLIRSVNESSQITVQCTIRKSMCLENESIEIFDLNKDFCVYNETVKTCNKTEDSDGIVHYTITVSNTFPNKYLPDHYVFCNSNGSFISTRITWESVQQSTTTEDNMATTASTMEQWSTIIVDTEKTTTTKISNIMMGALCALSGMLLAGVLHDIISRDLVVRLTYYMNSDDQCSCPNAYEAVELPTCKRNAIFECPGHCRG